METHKSDLLDQSQHHLSFDPHARGSSLSDVILGGQDGLVNVLGVILGVAAATSSTYIVLVAGLAQADNTPTSNSRTTNLTFIDFICISLLETV